MKGHLTSLLAGLAAAAGAAWILGRSTRLQRAAARAGIARVNINSATLEQLSALPGVDAEIVDRIVENRPYRSKLELVERFVMPTAVYAQCRSYLTVTQKQEGIKIA